MGLSVFPAPSSGGATVAYPNAGELVSSGTIGDKGFFLSDVLPAGDYIVAADFHNQPNTSEESYMSVNAFNSNVYTPYVVTDSADGVRVKITENDRIAISAPWWKAGAEFVPGNSWTVAISGLDVSWDKRSYFNCKFYNTDKYYQFLGTYNNSSSNQITYHDFSTMTSLDAMWSETNQASADDANLGGQRPHTAGGVVGNYAYFAFLDSTAAQRIWRANLSTPNTWTVGTTAATTSGYITGIAFGASTYVLVTSTGNINTSPDFSTWTKQTSPVTSIRDITFANGLFVVVGQAGDIATSPNGFTWTKRTAPAGIVNLYNVNYIGSKYIAIGGQSNNNREESFWGAVNKNYHAKSSDGITWTSFDLQATKSALNASATLKYGSWQQNQRDSYTSSSNINYASNKTYVHNGWLYTDIVNQRKFVTADGDNWYCLYRFWDNSTTITTVTHGQLNVDGSIWANQGPAMAITKPQVNAKIFIYKELA